ncbi:hypothetical protein ACP275_02G107900 [Erythranthe tilingii]
MEQDSLLAHGASYMLHNRFHISSDSHIISYVCSICGSLLNTSLIQLNTRELRRKIPTG